MVIYCGLWSLWKKGTFLCSKCPLDWHFTQQGLRGGVCGGATVRTSLGVFFSSHSLSLASEACLLMPGGTGFSVISFSKLLRLMISHLLAWKGEFGLSKNGDLLFPFVLWFWANHIW